MEWTIKLEAKTGWGEVMTCEIGALHRSLGELTTDGVGMSLAEAKSLLAELQQKIVLRFEVRASGARSSR